MQTGTWNKNSPSQSRKTQLPKNCFSRKTVHLLVLCFLFKFSFYHFNACKSSTTCRSCYPSNLSSTPMYPLNSAYFSKEDWLNCDIFNYIWNLVLVGCVTVTFLNSWADWDEFPSPLSTCVFSISSSRTDCCLLLTFKNLSVAWNSMTKKPVFSIFYLKKNSTAYRKSSYRACGVLLSMVECIDLVDAECKFSVVMMHKISFTLFPASFPNDQYLSTVKWLIPS